MWVMVMMVVIVLFVMAITAAIIFILTGGGQVQPTDIIQSMHLIPDLLPLILNSRLLLAYNQILHCNHLIYNYIMPFRFLLHPFLMEILSAFIQISKMQAPILLKEIIVLPYLIQIKF